jgi:adenosine deaminase
MMDGAMASIEKAELHCHVDGLLDPPMLTELVSAGLDPGVSADALRAACPAASLKDWIERYCAIVNPAVIRPEILSAMLVCHIHRLPVQGVGYTEIMVSGMLAGEDEGAVVEIFRRLRAAASEAAAEMKVRVELLVAVNYRSAERFSRQVDRILAIRKAGLIRGVAIAGQEPRPTLAASADEFSRMRDAGLGIEVHAGEWAGPDSVRDALRHANPDRIGHGIAIFTDEALLDEIRRHDIHIEMCPTSNVLTGAVKSMETHPIRRAREIGMNISVSTDDPAPFGCSMNSEYELIAHVFGFADADFENMWRNALRSSFAER